MILSRLASMQQAVQQERPGENRAFPVPWEGYVTEVID